MAGATEVWMPEYEEIYPTEIKKLSAGQLGTLYEGQSRPDHFDGVVTVVNRLFEIVKPKMAVFGEKDFQQLVIIQAMKCSVEIVGVPTVREFDGLALSSRNVRLSEQGRVSANVIQRALAAAHLAPSIVIAQEIIDSTLATPLAQRPHDHGVSIVLHSATKGIAGHNDATLGVIAADLDLINDIWAYAVLHGATASPFDAMNGLRGIRTLDVRLARQSETAQELAEWLLT
ncbi:MAG: hypothetical protein RJA68_946, partial [Actinomycetota bacterium]